MQKTCRFKLFLINRLKSFHKFVFLCYNNDRRVGFRFNIGVVAMWKRIEVVATSRTRNAVTPSRRTRVRISPFPPTGLAIFFASLFFGFDAFAAIFFTAVFEL